MLAFFFPTGFFVVPLHIRLFSYLPGQPFSFYKEIVASVQEEPVQIYTASMHG